jgi:hypothetical protein
VDEQVAGGEVAEVGVELGKDHPAEGADRERPREPAADAGREAGDGKHDSIRDAHGHDLLL